jgi:hypothetical protein
MDGSTVADRLSDDAWTDPITRTTFLRPLPLTAEWANTFSGSYARYQKSAYSLITSSAWIQHPKRDDGDWFLESVDAATFSELVTTTASFSANRALFFSFFNNGTGDESETVFECGQGAVGGADTVSLRVRGNGDVDLFKGTTLLDTYDLSSVPVNVAGSRQSGKSINLAQRVVSFLWIPCRRRDLLIYCITTGGGFVHTFSDLDPSTVNDVTPSGAAWWRVLTGRPSVQFAPVKFKTSGAAYGRSTQLRYPPETGRVFALLPAQDDAGYGVTSTDFSLVQANTLAPFTPDGIENNLRLKVALTGDGDWSPFVYAADAFAEPVATSTAETPYNLTCEVSDLGIEVDDTGRGKISFGLPRPEESLLPRLRETHERPYRLAVQNDAGTITVDVMRGTLEAPETLCGKDEDGEFDVLKFAGWDRQREFDRYRFAATVPYDGVELVDAFENLARLPGYGSGDLDITSDLVVDFLLPYTTGVSLGEWQLLPELGDTITDWQERLHRDYAATWRKQWRPTASGYRWECKDPSEFSDTPVIELFRSRADALAFGLTSEQAEDRVVYSRRRRPVAPEANQVQVIGYDPRLKRYVTAQSNDTASQTPGTDPALRPDNWMSRLERYQLIDPSISTQDAADRAALILEDRLFPNRLVEEWTAAWLVRVSDYVPAWRGDVLRLWETVTGPGTGAYTDWRIRSLKAAIRFLGNGDQARKILDSEGAYTVEKIGAGVVAE